MSVINNELTCLALTGCVPLNARRRSASCVVEGVQSDSTHNSTQLDVELSYVAINGALSVVSMISQTTIPKGVLKEFSLSDIDHHNI